LKLLNNNLNHRITSRTHRQNGTCHARSMAATQIGSEWKVVFIGLHSCLKQHVLSS